MTALYDALGVYLSDANRRNGQHVLVDAVAARGGGSVRHRSAVQREC